MQFRLCCGYSYHPIGLSYQHSEKTALLAFVAASAVGCTRRRRVRSRHTRFCRGCAGRGHCFSLAGIVAPTGQPSTLYLAVAHESALCAGTGCLQRARDRGVGWLRGSSALPACGQFVQRGLALFGGPPNVPSTGGCDTTIVISLPHHPGHR